MNHDKTIPLRITPPSPLLTAGLLSAFYSALLLKHAQGIEITPDVEELTMREVLSLYKKMEKNLRPDVGSHPSTGQVPPESADR